MCAPAQIGISFFISVEFHFMNIIIYTPILWLLLILYNSKNVDY